MRTLAALLFVPACLLAQSAAEGALRDWMRQVPAAPWFLLLEERPGIQAAYAGHPDLVKLVVERDLRILAWSSDLRSQLRAAEGWGEEPHWLLVSREGGRVAEGRGWPEGRVVAEALAGVGWTGAWARREAFLAWHPEHGEALTARLDASLGLVAERLAQAGPRGFEGPDQEVRADVLWGEVAESIERLLPFADLLRNDNPGLWRTWYRLMGRLRPGHADASPRMRAVLKRLRVSLLEAWSRSPHGVDPTPLAPEALGPLLLSPGVWWEQVSEACGEDARLPDLLPAPGRGWPSRMGVEDHGRAEAPQARLARLEAMASRPPQPPVEPQAWRDWTGALADWNVQKAEALAALGRWDEAGQALEEARRWGGAGWGRRGLKEAFGPRRGMPIPPPDFQAILDQPVLPDPLPPPGPLPVRMVVCGDAPPGWETLKAAPKLAPWGPQELQWERATARDLERLPRGSRWGALEAPVRVWMAGEKIPKPELLSQVLQARGRTRLQRLDAFLREHPDHLDARADRFSLLVPRLPNPALEGRVREDASLGGFALPFGPADGKVMDLVGWQGTAQALLPRIEASLRHWPRSERLWRLWLDWAGFAPARPSITALLDGLTPLGARSEWCFSLPPRVHEAVRQELRAGRQFGRMRAWFQLAWEGEREAGVEFGMVDRAGHRRCIFDGLSESLQALGLQAELGELEHERKGRDQGAFKGGGSD